MPYVLTTDICQPIISGYPIKNNSGYIYVNPIVGGSGISQATTTYQDAVNLCNSLDSKLTNRFDDTTYYGL